ncbi:response regulator [bacterium]|nr:response regulator [bacterium]
MTNNKKILVVEDEAPLLKAIKTKLEKSGFDVITARRARQAFEYLKELGDIDAVWLDHYLLGKEDGLYFVIKAKKDLKYRSIPIFVVSNTASADKVSSYINFGVDKYYVKSDYRLDNIISDIKKDIGVKNK